MTNKDFPIHDVWTILCKGYLIKDKWSDFATCLKVPSEIIKRFCADPYFSVKVALKEILTIWVGQEGSGATLLELLRVIEDGCGDNYVGEQLRLAFNLPCKGFQEDSTWSCLAPAFQEKVEQEISNYFGNILIDTDMKGLAGKILLDLMTGKEPELFNSTIPLPPKFYLERILLPRHKISKKLFEDIDNDAPDIFLFAGLDINELIDLVGVDEASTSSEQLLESTELSVNFMVLDESSHFQQICEVTSSPVHLLSYDKNCENLNWIKTRDSVNRLLKFVEDCGDPLKEGEFLELVKSKNNCSRSILISDSPGMGKSFLLANIALNLQPIIPKDGLVIFTKVKDFIKQIKENSGSGNAPKESIKMALQTIISNNALGNSVFSRKLFATDIKIELLLDGFDEVNINEVGLALKTIKEVHNSFRSIRLWITTRPHHLEELEEGLNVLGYNIKGLDEEEQINFLVSQWKNSTEISTDCILEDKLKEYSQAVLRGIKSQLNKDDNDIAGVPLQCFLIGEVFKRQSISIAKAESVISAKIGINSISELYEKFINHKAEEYVEKHGTAESPSAEIIIEAHINHSIKSLFPHYQPKFNQNVPDKALLNMGIIQSVNVGNAQFLHQTFAEYFVARYIVEELNEKEIEDEFVTFLLGDILQRSQFIFTFPLIGQIASCRFVQRVICYFVNTKLARKEKRGSYFVSKAELKEKTEIYQACTNSSFLQLFKLFFEQQSSKIDKEIVYLAIRNSTYEYVKFVLNSFVSLAECDLQLYSIFLRLAVQRGEPLIFTCLSKSKLLVKIYNEVIMDLNEDTKLLLHDCVSNTKYKAEADIARRLDMIGVLIKANSNLLKEKDDFGRTPLLCECAHVELLKQLIKLGADVNSKDVLGDTVLHLSKNQSRRFSSNEYHSLLTTISKSTLVQVLNAAANDDETPLLRLIHFIDLGKETFDIFLENEVHSDNAALRVAIRDGRNSQTLENLIKLSGDVDTSWRGKEGEGYLHLAAQHGNLDALKLLIEKYKLDANAKDFHSLTPMDYTIISKVGKSRLETAKILYNFGGRANVEEEYHLDKAIKNGNAESVRIIQEVLAKKGIARGAEGKSLKLSVEEFKLHVRDFVTTNNSSFRDSDGRSVLHIAALRGDELAAKELVENKFDLNNTDLIGNTPLHTVCFCTDFPIKLRIIKLLIDNGADARVKNRDSCTFIDLFFSPGSLISPSQFHQVVEYLAGRNPDLLYFLFSSKSVPQGWTPLHRAGLKLELEEKTILLLKDANISFNEFDDYGQNPLLSAISGGRSKTFVNLLIDKCGADWKLMDKQGSNGLHVAAEFGNLGALKKLIDLGMDVNEVNLQGLTPLQIVAKEGKKNVLEVAKILVEMGADVNRTTSGLGRCTAQESIMIRNHSNQLSSEICAAFVEILNGGNKDSARAMLKLPNALRDTDPPANSRMDKSVGQNQLPLHKAVASNINDYETWDVIKSLIRPETDLCAKDQNGYTFLHLILFRKPLPTHFHTISEYLLATIGCKELFETPENKWGANALHCAVRYFQPEMKTLELFESHGINFNQLDAHGDSLLMYAIRGKRSPEFLFLLVTKFGVNPRNLNNDKQSFVHISAQDCNEDALKFFLNLHIPVNFKDIGGNTALHNVFGFASNLKNVVEIVKILIDNGADVNAKNNVGATPLHQVNYLLDTKIAIDAIKYLVKNGADPNAKNCEEWTPLFYAINQLRQRLPIIKCLIDNEADVKALDFNKTGFIHLASEVGGVEVLKFFLDMNVLDVNAVDGDGNTPIQCAIAQKESTYMLEKVRILLKSGADVRIRDKSGKNALDCVDGRGDLDEKVRHELKDLLKLS